jgi:RNA polymerase sigma factor (sigma-70 family)
MTANAEGPDYTRMDPAELIDRCREEPSDKWAFEQLVKRYGGRVRAGGLRVLRDADAAEDVFQETFILLFRIAKQRTPECLDGWIVTVARNLAIRRREKDSRYVGSTSLESDLCDASSPEEETVHKETVTLLRRAIDSLPGIYSQVLTEHYLCGKSMERIAQETGLSVNTIKARGRRALRLLRNRLQGLGLRCLPVGPVIEALAERVAQAEVPPELLQSTIRAALDLVGKAGMTGPPPALREPTSVTRRAVSKLLALFLLAAGVTAAGVALIARGVSHRARPVLAIRDQRGVKCIAIGPDGQVVLGLSDGKTKLINKAGAEVHVDPFRHAFGVNAIAFSRDGTRVASCSQDKTVIWDTSSGNQIASRPHRQGASGLSVALHPNGQFVASAGGDGTVLLWQVSNGNLLWSLPGAGRSVAWSPDGQWLATLGAQNGLQIWGVGTRSVPRQPTGPALKLPGPEGSLHRLAFSPDSRRLAAVGVWSATSSALVWDLESQAATASRDIPGVIKAMTFTPDGGCLGATIENSQRGGEVILWNVIAGEKVGTLPLGEEVKCLGFSADGQRLVVSATGRLTIWDVSEVLKQKNSR